MKTATTATPTVASAQAPRVVSTGRATSLFSGIGGLDMGLASAGFDTTRMCEVWVPARRVLSERFVGVSLHGDVGTFEAVNQAPDVLAAGFPCTDLSHAGGKAGIFGPSSGLVEHVFRFLASSSPEWVLLENVPNLLALHKGRGMKYVVEQLERLGFGWAYRTVDARAFGLPQRRPRVLILASRDQDPRVPLLAQRGVDPIESTLADEAASGFYWTEGRNGVGLVAGAVPTLKGGSTLGLPSAPAIWFPGSDPGRKFVLPSIEDGEALQGLPRGWTAAAVVPGEPDLRWKLVGNAVAVGVGEWIGRRIAGYEDHDAFKVDEPPRSIDRDRRWPAAGWGGAAEAWQSDAAAWPEVPTVRVKLEDVVDADAAQPLSHRATTGFLDRLDKAGINVDERFYADLEQHQQVSRPAQARRRPQWETDAGTRARMSKQKQRDTKPEVVLRRELHALGLRYRLQTRPEADLRARLDIVFGPSKVAVDVRGCFWHRCPQHGTKPRANADRWQAKLDRNVQRDAEVAAALEERGWQVVVVWEHDDAVAKAAEIAAIVTARRRDRSRPVKLGATG